MRNDDFKMAFVNFIELEWVDNRFAEIIGAKVVLVTYKKNCRKFSAENGMVNKSEYADYYCKHEEGDSRIYFHINTAKHMKSIVIKSF